MTAEDVTDVAAALMNDPQGQQFTFSVLLPYLNLALQMLQEEFELSNVPSTNQESDEITVPLGVADIGGDSLIDLPDGLIEIQQLWSRPVGSQNQFLPMTRYDFIPHYLFEQQFNIVEVWSFQDQIIKFAAALGATVVKIDYIKSLFSNITSSSTPITVINCGTYLQFMTASLASRYIGENPTRADSLEIKAVEALDRTIGISTKGRQSIQTRRRPFRASYKRRSYAGS